MSELQKLNRENFKPGSAKAVFTLPAFAGTKVVVLKESILSHDDKGIKFGTNKNENVTAILLATIDERERRVSLFNDGIEDFINAVPLEKSGDEFIGFASWDGDNWEHQPSMSTSESNDETIDFNSMSVPQLKAHAKENEIDISEAKTKQAIIDIFDLELV